MEELAWPDVAPRIAPVLGTAFYLPHAPAVVRLAFLPLLWGYAALVEERGLRLLLASEATSWGRSFQDVVAEGILNVTERPIRIEMVAAGTFEIVTEDGLASSRMLVPGWLDSMRDVLGGTPVCGIPARDRCILASAEWPEALEAALDIVESAWRSQDDSISPVLYTVNEERLIVPLALSDDHPLAPRLQRVHALFAAHEYEEQGAAIDAALQEEGDLVVGTCRVMPHPSGAGFTATTFVEGVDSLLPVTDLVFLAWQAGDEAEYLLVRREDLAEIAPKRLVAAPDYDPPRVATLGFPDATELEQLRARALASSGPVR